MTKRSLTAGVPFRGLAFALSLLATAPGLAQEAHGTRRSVIIYTDPGTDDAMAILLALNSPEIDVEAMTVVPGNVGPEQALLNARTLLALAGRCDIPVAAGAKRPLAQALHTAEFVHGQNGLANIELPVEPCDADPRSASELIIEMLRAAPGSPMHDPLAMGVAIDPSFVRTRHMNIDVETRGELTRGATVSSRVNPGDPNVHVGVEVEAERFMSFFIDRLAGK